MRSSAIADSNDKVLIHDLSETGLLFESSAKLKIGELVQVDLPSHEQTRARVVWASGNLFGCEFERPISKGATSAAILKSPALQRPADTAKPWYTQAEQESPEPHVVPYPRWARMFGAIALALLSWGLIVLIATLIS